MYISYNFLHNVSTIYFVFYAKKSNKTALKAKSTRANVRQKLLTDNQKVFFQNFDVVKGNAENIENNFCHFKLFTYFKYVQFST